MTATDGRSAPLEMLAVVDAPIEHVWAVVADIPRQVEWMREMKSVSDRHPGSRPRSGRAPRRPCGSSASRPAIPSRSSSSIRRARYAIRHLGLFAGDGVFTLEPGADGTTTIVRWQERLEPPVLPALGAVVAGPDPARDLPGRPRAPEAPGRDRLGGRLRPGRDDDADAGPPRRRDLRAVPGALRAAAAGARAATACRCRASAGSSSSCCSCCASRARRTSAARRTA